MIPEGSLSRIYGEYNTLDESSPDLGRYLEERFQIPYSTWDDYLWAQREGTRSIWVLGKNSAPPAGLSLDTWGVAAFRTFPPVGYPTNVFMRAFGHLAQTGVFDLHSLRALEAYVAGENTREGTPPPERGYCIVRHNGLGLGRGRWTGEELVSELPKVLRVPRKTSQGKG